MLVRMRAPLSLVAVLLVIAVIAAVLVGGRLFQDFSSLHRSTPAATPPTATPATATLAELEARPITLPVIGATDACPQHWGTNSLGYQYGDGPIYANGSNGTNTNAGSYFYIAYYAEPNLHGQVLIRGRDLRNANIPVVFVGSYATGPVAGNNPFGTGSQYKEAVLDASNPPGRTINKFGVWTVHQGLSKAASLCFGFQIDGTGFTEFITAGS